MNHLLDFIEAFVYFRFKSNVKWDSKVSWANALLYAKLHN